MKNKEKAKITFEQDGKTIELKVKYNNDTGRLKMDASFSGDEEEFFGSLIHSMVGQFVDAISKS